MRRTEPENDIYALVMMDEPEMTEAEIREEIHTSMEEYAAARVEATERECEQLRSSLRESDDQMKWIADWCSRTIGVENNSVIGRDGWPRRLVEVVAKAVEEALAPKDAP